MNRDTKIHPEIISFLIFLTSLAVFFGLANLCYYYVRGKWPDSEEPRFLILAVTLTVGILFSSVMVYRFGRIPTKSLGEWLSIFKVDEGEKND